MKTLRVKKGKHASNDWYGITFKAETSFDFIFDNDSTYNLEGEDQKDWNKLFGFTDCILPRLRFLAKEDVRNVYCDFKIPFTKKNLAVFFPRHWRSARFAWRYNIAEKVFELTYYVYVDGKRMFGSENETYVLFFNKRITARIEKIEPNQHFFIIKDYQGKSYFSKTITTTKHTIWGITLPMFFGGNCAAPNTIKIKRYDATF